MKENLKVLLVEDDPNLGALLSEYLQAKGYAPQLCSNGQDGWQAFENGNFDFCILDVMLPQMDGFTLGEKIRALKPHLPMVFLTAKSLKDDTIRGLKIGADDYLTKPFRMEELLLRMQAILRRAQTPRISEEMTDVFQIGRYQFNYPKRELSSGEKSLRLTSKEADLLRLLCLHKNQVVGRSFALTQIWEHDTYFNARSMDVYITKLRKYLKADEHLQIVNVHGQGFKLVELFHGSLLSQTL
ncbi:MAG: response regulator transcription factor [Microscillaceae bacterium]